MREELAGRLLDQLFDWSDEERTESVTALARLAQFKFDHYEGFSAGERFFERLARWLVQFEGEADRRRLLEFVRSELVFISRDEMNQAISCAYPHHIRQLLIAQTAESLNLPEHMLAQITSSAEFRAIRRATLFLGLSDGARLDLLRRSSSELSHEQFSLSPELGEGAQKSMQGETGRGAGITAVRRITLLPEHSSLLTTSMAAAPRSLINARTDRGKVSLKGHERTSETLQFGPSSRIR